MMYSNELVMQPEQEKSTLIKPGGARLEPEVNYHLIRIK